MKYSILAIVALLFGGISCEEQERTKTYDEDRAKRAMAYSAATYCLKSTIENWSCGEACDYFEKIKTAILVEDPVLRILGYVTYDSEENEIVVAFRGTNGLDRANWLQNLKMYMKPIDDEEDILVHAGILESYLGIKDGIRAAVKKLLQSIPQANIFVTGHSLGGALANLAALDIKTHLLPAKN